MIVKILLGLAAALTAGVVWLYTAVRRGAASRDALLLARLDPLAARLEQKATVSPDEVTALAAVPELRSMLHTLLSRYRRTELFPVEYLSRHAQAEAALVHWLLHPNELRSSPSAIELVEVVQRDIHGKQGEFFVFRYRMPAGHWAGPDWLLGVAGPFYVDDEPYQSLPGAFSRSRDSEGKVAPGELVGWYVDMLQRKSRA